MYPITAMPGQQEKDTVKSDTIILPEPVASDGQRPRLPAIIPSHNHDVVLVELKKIEDQLPAILQATDQKTRHRFIDFFTSSIRNPNTRAAYQRAVGQFLRWCQDKGITDLHQVRPIVIAAYIEQMQTSRPTIKQHRSAISKMFDWLVTGGVLEINPASAVKAPRHIVRTGKTPVLSAGETRHLLDGIKLHNIVGLRDRALIGVMVYNIGRVGAVIAMRAEDYYQSGKRWHFRLHEKGGKEHAVPAHHNGVEYLDDYLNTAGIASNPKAPLFQTVDRHKKLTGNPMTRIDVYRMIKRRARKAGLPSTTCCHTFRATGITTYLSNGGTLENARAIAAHESSQTTRLYDRTGDNLTLDEIERIVI